MRRAQPQFDAVGIALTAAYRGIPVFEADVEDARMFAEDPADPVEVARMVVQLVSLRHRLATSGFSEEAIENEP